MAKPQLRLIDWADGRARLLADAMGLVLEADVTMIATQLRLAFEEGKKAGIEAATEAVKQAFQQGEKR